MLPFRRCVFWAMIPLNLMCIGWVWCGRALFGVGGWMFVILLVAVPVLLLALAVTSLLAFAQQIPYARGFLTTAQAGVQTAVWATMIGFGAFLVDFGDAADSEASVLTQAVGEGDSTIALSSTLSAICGVAFLATYAWLLTLLIIGTKNRPRPTPRAGQYGPFAAPPGHPPPGPPPPPWA